MELSVYEMFPIEDEYQMRSGDYIVTYGIFQEKGRDGKFHKCHVEIKRVRKPIQRDAKQIIYDKDLRIKELEEQLKQTEIAANFNNTLLTDMMRKTK